MSLQILVNIEVGESTTSAAELRISRIETIVAANLDSNDWSDVVALGQVIMRRLVEDAHEKAHDQLADLGARLSEK